LHGSGGGAAAGLLASARLRWLAVVIAVMAVLTAGWPLLNRVVSDHSRLAASTRLAIGPSHKNGAIVTVGPGWTLRASETNPRLAYTLQRGPVILSITYATLINNRQAGDLWAGLRDVVQIGHPGATLSAPVSVRTINGSAGDIGLVRSPDLAGTASVFAGPTRQYAIEMVIAAPKGSPRLNLVAAQRIMQSLVFPAAAAAKAR
jgi:hypothetical protein